VTGRRTVRGGMKSAESAARRTTGDPDPRSDHAAAQEASGTPSRSSGRSEGVAAASRDRPRVVYNRTTMTDVSIVVAINAPPERVLAVLFDIERWPEWTSTMTSVRRMDDGPLSVGSRARVRQPRLIPAVWQVTELDRNSRFTWITHSPGVQLKAEHVVEPDGTGSRAALSLRFSGPLGPLVARLVRGLSERYLAIEAAGLRNRCEDSGRNC
jgi:hypothetical protein